MKVKRRKFNIFEQMDRAIQESMEKGPVEEFVLTPEEFAEFVRDAKNRPGMSFKKIVGRPGDDIGGDWSFRGAVVRVSGKLKS